MKLPEGMHSLPTSIKQVVQHEIITGVKRGHYFKDEAYLMGHDLLWTWALRSLR